MKKCLFLLFYWFLAGGMNLSAEPFNRIGQGIRNLGMGNVGVALSHDENALHYNPAGLVGVDEFFVNLGILGEVSDDLLNAQDEISTVQKLGDASTADTLEIALGKKIHLRFMVNTNVLIPFGGFTFGLSALGEGRVRLGFQNPVLPRFNFSYQVDAPTYTYGVAIPLGRGGLVLGFGARYVTRVGLPDVELSIDNLISSNDSEGTLDEYSGATKFATGQGYDVGLHWRVEGDWKLTLGVVGQNVGSLSFANGSNKYPENVPGEYSAGLSLQPGSDYLRFLFAFDIRDITTQGTDDSFMAKRIHTGIEIGILPIDSGASFISLRSGYNQGYFSYGFEINPFIFARFVTLQVAVYSEETGSVPGGGKESRRAFQLSFAF
ncbi:MAG: hypothetical protein HQM13_20775 [SAR324 cluster bacterium]|nr:hypothetical protein [SAR324 cluster bacterium]